jgi:hypothetical protein
MLRQNLPDDDDGFKACGIEELLEVGGTFLYVVQDGPNNSLFFGHLVYISLRLVYIRLHLVYT